MKFSLVTLFVKDPAAVRDWYTTQLGFAVSEETDKFVRLSDRNGQQCLAFHVGSPVGRPDHVQLHFEVDDVDAAYERLRGTGVVFDEPPGDKPWGWRVATLTDPAGHMVELVQRL